MVVIELDREIEFNNGFVTALALFYGHREQFTKASSLVGHDLRINGASDHLFDIEYPANLDVKLRRKIQKFVKDVLETRRGFVNVSIEDGNELFERCKDLLKEIDEICFGLNVEIHYG